jgi:hypothetical protein
MGHQDAFLPPRLSSRYPFSKRTLAGTQGNGRDAPKPVISDSVNRRRVSTLATIGTSSIGPWICRSSAVDGLSWSSRGFSANAPIRF